MKESHNNNLSVYSLYIRSNITLLFKSYVRLTRMGTFYSASRIGIWGSAHLVELNVENENIFLSITWYNLL